MPRPIKRNLEVKKTQEGYILIELAIVFLVIGLLITALIPLYQSYQQRDAKAETEERIDFIAKSFSAFLQTRWRLPCPAAAVDSHGIIPYRTLGIPEQYAKDGYGNFFTYTVSPDFTTDNRLGIGPDRVHRRLAHLFGGENPSVAGDDEVTGRYALLPIAQFCAPLINTVSDITVRQDGAPLYAGAARNIDDTARGSNPNANLINRDSKVTAVAMVLISHGENGNGAYQSNGSRSAASDLNTAEELTSRNDNRLIVTESVYSNTGTAEYDDIVNFYTQDEIFALAGRQSCEHL